jgi:catechol 2,3-dioxygenase-like lactoylglutathione lyase family enzyme
MLSDSPAVAVVAVSDLDGAKDFYGDLLGLGSGDEEPGGILYTCAPGSQLLVYQSGFAGTNQATAASWQVEDLEGETAALQAKGITFEEYDIPGIERDGVIHTAGNLRAVWFKDPEGNILNLVERS